MSPATATCSCGGRFNLDVQYLFDARRFSLLGHVPILWRCAVCGRSLVEGQTATAITGGDSRELRRGAARVERDAADDTTDFESAGGGSRSRRSARGPARSRISRRS
jgi:hypothetical protein